MSLRHSLRLLLLCALLALPSLVLAQAPCTPVTTVRQNAALAWTAPTQRPEITPAGYRLDRMVESGAWTRLVDLAATETTYLDANLTPNRTYYYRLTALGKTSDGAIVASAYATTREDGTLQPCLLVVTVAAPTNFSATPQ